MRVEQACMGVCRVRGGVEGSWNYQSGMEAYGLGGLYGYVQPVGGSDL